MTTKVAPKSRRNTSIAASIFYFLTIPFLIMVIIGNTYKGTALTGIYFYQLDVSEVIPISVDNANLLNSVARSLGLHDFYQVGLWNFCEGYLDEGVTYCSKPKQFYWFNPVEVLVSELLAGARIALPSQAVTVLKLLRIGSRVMYGFFMAGIVLNFILMFTTPLVKRTRWWSLVHSLFGFIAAVMVTVAAIIGTAMSIAFKIALTTQDQLNIKANICVKMFVFMWIAAVFTIVAFLLHAAMGCCCKPRQTAESSEAATTQSEKPGKYTLPGFVRRRRGQASP